MQKALAAFRKGRVELTSPVDWHDGTAVEGIPLHQQIGINEDDWPTTADGIPSLLNRMDEATVGDDEPVEFAWDVAWTSGRLRFLHAEPDLSCLIHVAFVVEIDAKLDVAVDANDEAVERCNSPILRFLVQPVSEAQDAFLGNFFHIQSAR